MWIAGLNLGLEAYGVAFDPVGQEIRNLRETLARVKDFFTVIFKPEPTYLGETIPSSGNGDLTMIESVGARLALLL